ncbi:MAG: AAA family ATPase [Acidovorax sp.]|uniref:ExeA family protein n=1 Tax=Acidovorax sp. TaxID=1872122 RepID=UPI0026163C77|nr:AAA family ATPase [Acidovorax sp.]MDH4463453.1 AAA family ATPase [Acidovorax sp.]
MYAGFFGLRQAPFSIAPDPHYLFMSERHREALAHLLYGVQGGGGFVLLTGEIGAGKTTVCRAFLEQVPANCRVAYIFNPKLTVNDLLKTICHEFRIEVRPDGGGPATIKDHLDPLNEYLLASHAQGQHSLLIIDEAQNLSPHVLEQLRLLTNLETHERKLLQIVLIGQPELRGLLAQPELEQLAQRVIARFHLGALSEAETRQYVRHRMEVAGLTGPLPFSDAAMARVHALTRGVPRRINLLCDRALLGAYASDRREVDPAIVDRAAQEVFDLPEALPAAPATAHTPRPWAALGLGALGGAAVLGSAVLALWQWPGLLTSLLPDREPTAAARVTPSVPVAAASNPTATATAAATVSTSDPPSATPTAPASATAPADAIAPLSPMPDRAALLTSENTAWRELGPLWNQPLAGDDPCASAQAVGLQCFRTARMSLHGLRQLDRPGILTLQLADGPARALVTALTADSVTLQVGDQRWRMGLDTLASVWRGDYATLWRTPPGTTGRIGNVGSGPAVQWLDQRLQGLQAAGQLPATAQDYAARLQAFQTGQGIDGGGKATPMTFMQVNRLSGVAEPRLISP